MAKKYDVAWEPGGRIGRIIEETKIMTPDERLREAVGRYLNALEWGSASEALENLRSVYNEDPRPCISAAVKLRKPWWRFW